MLLSENNIIYSTEPAIDNSFYEAHAIEQLSHDVLEDKTGHLSLDIIAADTAIPSFDTLEADTGCPLFDI